MIDEQNEFHIMIYFSKRLFQDANVVYLKYWTLIQTILSDQFLRFIDFLKAEWFQESQDLF